MKINDGMRTKHDVSPLSLQRLSYTTLVYLHFFFSNKFLAPCLRVRCPSS